MSNVKIFAEKKEEKGQWLSLEHGFKYIKLSIFEDYFPLKSMSVELSPKEAMKLAEDLLKRAKEILK